MHDNINLNIEKNILAPKLFVFHQYIQIQFLGLI